MVLTIAYSNKIDLDRFFYHLQGKIYVIYKVNDFPNYYSGSDIDVFCYDIAECARTILNVGNFYVVQDFEIKVSHVSKFQIYIDFYYENKLDFRFDLYGSLPKYKKVHLKPHYVYSVIENASTIERCFNQTVYPIFVPSPVDDILLRYIEYVEWYEIRPDKIKHLDYIASTIASEPSRIGFLDKLHAFTELPEIDIEYDKVKPDTGLNRLLRFIKKVRLVPVSSLPMIAFRKIMKQIKFDNSR